MKYVRFWALMHGVAMFRAGQLDTTSTDGRLHYYAVASYCFARLMRAKRQISTHKPADRCNESTGSMQK